MTGPVSSRLRLAWRRGYPGRGLRRGRGQHGSGIHRPPARRDRRWPGRIQAGGTYRTPGPSRPGRIPSRGGAASGRVAISQAMTRRAPAARARPGPAPSARGNPTMTSGNRYPSALRDNGRRLPRAERGDVSPAQRASPGTRGIRRGCRRHMATHRHRGERRSPSPGAGGRRRDRCADGCPGCLQCPRAGTHPGGPAHCA